MTSTLLWVLCLGILALSLSAYVIRSLANRPDTAAPSIHSFFDQGLVDATRWANLQADLARVRPTQVRRANALRKGGAIPRAEIEAQAPAMKSLYFDPAVRALAERVFQLPPGALQLIQPDNQMSLCVYLYDQPGDFIAWHFDKPAYNSDRFILLVCLESTADAHLETRARAYPAKPGEAVFFIGERMKHRVTPVTNGGSRVMLQLEYVTDCTRTAAWRTAMRKFTDSLFYFGFAHSSSSDTQQRDSVEHAICESALSTEQACVRT